MGKKILIIGGVAAGPKAASRARRRDPEAEITIVERKEIFSYAGCGMPFYIEGSIEDVNALLCTPSGVKRDEKYFKNVKDIEVLGNTEALKINRDEKTVTVRDVATGKTLDLPYDKLVLGVGARPFLPRMEGTDLKGVYHLYDTKDAEDIRRALGAGVKKVAIVGGGLIGMEVCGAFVSRGCDVSVFEMMDHLVPNLLDKDLALLLEKYLRDKGVMIHTGCRVKGLLDDGSGHVKGVEIADGEMHGSEMVLVAIGVKPNTELAAEAGLELGETHAIAVNEYLQTSDSDIYAGGDCVENTCMITGMKVYTPMGSTANKHGRVIGDNVTGGETLFPGVTRTVVFKILDRNIGKTGLTEKEAVNLGYDVVTAIVPRPECSNYYPGSKSFVMKLVAYRKTGKFLGLQVFGAGEAVKRIDVAATALKFGASVKDISDTDLAYAPPFSTAIDAVAHAANVVRNKIDLLARSITPINLKAKMDRGDDFVLLDVRSKKEVDELAIMDSRFKHIPLGQLRERVDELHKDKEVVIYCKSSVRAWEAQRVLDNIGFKDVKFLEGSIIAWPYTP